MGRCGAEEDDDDLSGPPGTPGGGGGGDLPGGGGDLPGGAPGPAAAEEALTDLGANLAAELDLPLNLRYRRACVFCCFRIGGARSFS